MTKQANQWQQRVKHGKQPIVKLLDFDFAGLKRGTTMLVSSPQEIDAYLRSIPFGETRTMEQLRADLAMRHGADSTCPASTVIFLRVVSEAAWEDLQAGSDPDHIAPFWRVVEPGSRLAQRLSCGSEFLQALREREDAQDRCPPPNWPSS